MALFNWLIKLDLGGGIIKLYTMTNKPSREAAIEGFKYLQAQTDRNDSPLYPPGECDAELIPDGEPLPPKPPEMVAALKQIVDNSKK
jgi:hypothetical protein